MAEYRFTDDRGVERTMMQPRVLARTTVLERHVIRSEVAGITIDAVIEPIRPSTLANSEATTAWNAFVERFIRETRFDDPAQPSPRRGGNGWIRIPLPDQLYVNAYRSASDGTIGVQVRFAGAEAEQVWTTLLADRQAIDDEFSRGEVAIPTWIDGDVSVIRVSRASPTPWDEAEEARQRQWMGDVANQFVNSLRPRLQRLDQELAA